MRFPWSVLSAHGVRVPKEIVVDKSDVGKALQWFESLEKKKVAIKPLFGSGGDGVHAGISSKDEIKRVLFSSKSKKVVLEEHIDGDDHRVLVVGGKVMAVMRRWPANVVGDGASSIEQLVENKNRKRLHNPYEMNYPIVIDSDIIRRLEKKGFTPDSVLPDGEKIFLKSIANIGVGGEGEDVTNLIHKSFISEAIKCWNAFDDLQVCGVDIIAEDITKPKSYQSYGTIEVNANCDISMHHWPAIGQPLDVASKIADFYFPDDVRDLTYSVIVNINGKVQKVGFRKWLAKQSIAHGVVGYCENNKEGEVIAYLEGSQNSVESIIMLCGKGPLKADVESVFFEEVTSKGLCKFMIY